MKNKIFRSVLAFLLAFSMLIPTVYIVFAETNPAPQIIVSQVEGKAGETVKVEIALANNPGIVSMTLKVDYNAEMLTMKKFTDAGVLGAQSHKPELTSPHTLVWVNDTATENFTANGTILTYEFEINENALANAVYPIEVSYTRGNYDIYDKDLNQVDFDTTVSGYVKVAFVPVNVTGVSLDKRSLSMKTGENQTLIATVSPDDATDKSLVWTSSNEAVATVDENGFVTGIKEGTATITVTTADGSFTDSCEVTVSCAHTNKSEFVAVASTCEIQGNNLYYVCNDCGKVFKADGVTETTVADETLPLAEHTYVHFDEDPATHFALGMKEHYTCDICMKLFDANKKEVTDSSVLTIPKIPHSYGDWQSDDVSHWHECGCGNIIDRASHSFAWETDKPATETETGLKHEECTVCGAVRNENTVIPKLEHTHEMMHYNAVAATCKTEGNVEYWHCSKCNKNYADASGVSELLTVVTPIDVHNHIGGTRIVDKKDAGCETTGYTGDTVCNGCNAVIVKGTEIPALGHNADNTKWHTDSTTHWHECSLCGEKLDVSAHKGGTATCQNKAVCDVCGQSYGDLVAHTFVEKADAQYLKSDATCVSKAVYYKSCSVCGEKSTETFVYGEVNPENHTGGTYIKNQKEATCYEEGYTGDICCSDCKAVITAGTVIEKNAHNPASVWSTDENYHWKECQTVGCGNIIDKAEHTGGEATCTKKAICEVCGVEYGTVNADNHKNTEIRNAIDATCTADGYTGDVYCKDCGVKIVDGTVIPAVGHKLNKIEAKEATHEADGNIEYYVCSVCGKLFRDAEAAEEIALEDTVIAKGEHDYGDSYKSDAENHWKECGCGNIIEKSAHDFGEWTVTKAATDTEKGSKERICSVCGYKQIVEIPAIGSTEEPTLPENPSESATSNGQEDTTIPNTGNADSVILWSCLMLVTAASVTFYEILKKKKRVK